MITVVALGAVFWTFVGLEAVYRWWLPPERPVRAVRPLPPFVRSALWAEFGGRGRPRLDPQIPFMVPVLIPLVLPSPDDRPAALASDAQASLLHAVSRNALRRRMRQIEFTTRSVALATWVSRHWSIEDVLDSVGAHAWMGDAGEGFEAAGWYYWRRPIHELAPHEVATLLAVVRSPRTFDPVCRPDRVSAAREDALERMRAAGLIDENAFERAIDTPLRVLPECREPPEVLPGRSSPERIPRDS
jgi:hypothetical protein